MVCFDTPIVGVVAVDGFPECHLFCIAEIKCVGRGNCRERPNVGCAHACRGTFFAVGIDNLDAVCVVTRCRHLVSKTYGSAGGGRRSVGERFQQHVVAIDVDLLD